MNLPAPNMIPKMNLLASACHYFLASACHDFHSLILKTSLQFKAKQCSCFQELLEISQGSVFSADFQTQERSWLRAENSLIFGSASGNLWTWRAAVSIMMFLQPQRAWTYVCKPSRHPFEKMADASNPACSIPSELSFWHTEKLDTWQRKNMCSSQPSRKKLNSSWRTICTPGS